MALINFEDILQVNSVFPGNFGGAIFTGKTLNSNRLQVCRVSYKTAMRIPASGECWLIKGKISNRDQYKNYIDVETYNIVSLPQAAYVERFLLKHPAFRGIHFGKTKVGKLMDAFGAEALFITLNKGDITKLSTIIPLNLAKKIIKQWQLIQNEIETTAFLIQHQLSIRLLPQILRICQTNTVERIKENPYGLVAFRGTVNNLWKYIDELAKNLSIPANDPRRLIGLVEYVLYGELTKGNTACPLTKLKKIITQYIKDPILTDIALDYSINKKCICFKRSIKHILVQSVGAAIIEHNIENHFKNLIHATQSRIDLLSNEPSKRSFIDYNQKFQKMMGYSFTEQQVRAISIALKNRISIISGFGGTGKTSVLKAIVDLSISPVFLLAISGKAKERAKEATGIKETYTIHGFIKLTCTNKLDTHLAEHSLIIIDESSMVDIILINKLLSLLEIKCKSYSLLMVGDTAQLAPVGMGLFWHKLVQSEKIPKVHLTEVHRTSSDGALHRIAMQIRSGELENLQEWQGESEGVYTVHCASEKESLCKTLQRLKMQLPDSQIITPRMASGYADSGTYINRYIQDSMNKSEVGISMGSSWISVNDPVIVTKNSYRHSLFNGNTGFLWDIEYDENGDIVGVFEFDKTVHRLRTTDCWTLGIKLAYAISIHKSQGSEYETSIICAVSSTPIFERSMLYTSITRSKKLSLIVGDQAIARLAAKRPNRSDQLCVGFEL